MKNRFLFITIIAIAMLILFILILFIFLPDAPWKYPLKIAKGNEIIKKIEKYYEENHHFPSKITELNIETGLEEIFFYDNYNSYFRLYFGTSLGESVVYNSIEKNWQ